MKPNEQVVGEAIRVDYSEKDGRLFLVFEIFDEKYKKDIKENWTNDIEFKIINRSLVKNE